MTRSTLIWRSATYHWRTNLAVGLGAVVGTAVLTGALLVGDSMRGSLLALTHERLGRIDHALVGPRFFRAALVQDIAGAAAFGEALGPEARAAGTILVRGSIERQDQTGEVVRRTGGVNVIGVDAAFLGLFPDVEGPAPAGETAWLNDRLAVELGATLGSRVVLRVEVPSALPRETFLGRRTETTRAIPLEVTRVALPSGLGRFGLRASQLQPKNVFVPLAHLQQALRQPDRHNTILVAGRGIDDTERADAVNRKLQARLEETLTLDDLALSLHTPASKVESLWKRIDRNRDGRLSPSDLGRLPTFLHEAADTDDDGVPTRADFETYFARHRNYLVLESRALLLAPSIVDAARRAAGRTQLTAEPVFGYLVNEMTLGDRHVPYSLVAAVQPTMPVAGADQLDPDTIVLTRWAADRLAARVDQTLSLTYYLPEARGGVLPTGQTTLRIGAIVESEGAVADDGWTPDYPGITDAVSMRDWDPPYQGFIDTDRIGDDDEAYWKRYRTAPKAFLSLEKARQLWPSRFGQTTSVRLFAGDGADAGDAAAAFTAALRRELDPAALGLAFQPVRAQGVAASAGGTDFAGLFVGLSFFLILSAALLVGLLFRLNVEQRARQIGILLATGHSLAWVRRSLLLEGTLLVAIASVAGVLVGVGYARLMILGLTTWWVDAIRTPFLEPHTTGLSLAIGYGSGVTVAVVSVWWAVRLLGRNTPQALLAGTAVAAAPPARQRRAARWAGRTAAGGALVAGAGALAGLTGAVPEAAAFGVSGAGALLACLAFVAWRMQAERPPSTLRSGPLVVPRLAVRNTMRHVARSVLTASLIAAATFLIVVVASMRHHADESVYEKHAGTGGFRLIAEAASPLHRLFATADDRRALDIDEAADGLMDAATIYPFRLRPGDEASCLNLYKPAEPRILGATDAFLARGGFSFAKSLAETTEEEANPWQILRRDFGEDVIPAVADANSANYILHVGLGEDLEFENDQGQPVKVRLVGLLSGSILQSELVVSEDDFTKHFPNRAGYSYFLIEMPKDDAAALESVLESALGDHGFDVTDAGRRLADYETIQNAYLDTFQTLGGLGLLLGTFGMATVLLRNALERRGELALLRALGFGRGRLGLMVVAENAFLLILGLAAGTVSALLAVAPHVLAAGAGIQWAPLAATLLGVLVVGLLAGLVAVAATLATPLLPALRSE